MSNLENIPNRENYAESEPKEIERKFRVLSLPENLSQYECEEIIQGYLNISEDGATEERLRKKGRKYFRTIKVGRGLERLENENEISKEEFYSLWDSTTDRRIKKTRYKIPCDNYTIELDIYHDNLAGLSMAEIEFSNKAESEKFVTPDWLKDVTGNYGYSNQALALYGTPESEKENHDEKEIPRYELEEGVEKLVQAVKEKDSQGDSGLIIEIAGGSASGKTSAIADKLKKFFGEDVLILSADDYYKGQDFMREEAQKGNVLNWDQPEAIDLALYKEHLGQLKAGEPIDKPIYDFKTGNRAGFEIIQPKKIIIAEGLFVIDDNLAGIGDIKTFVDIGTHGRIIRRLLRDVSRTGQKPADILKYFSEVVEPMHEQYIESTKKNADFIINNEYKPEAEAESAGLHEIQLKFKAAIDPNSLIALGARKIGSTVQIDNYYNPKDRDLVKTGEVLRIRDEDGRRILAYKGPKQESQARKRPMFEFEIDKLTEESFLKIYGESKKIVTKNRTSYQIGNVVVSIDEVTKNDGEKDFDLGDFIEVRLIDEKTSMEEMQAVVKSLGLDFDNSIKTSYFEM